MNRININRIVFIFLLVTCCLLLATFVCAELLDRVVALVDDEIIMQSELNEAYQKALNFGTEATQEEVLRGLINRTLLLKQARRTNRKHVFSAQTVADDNILINEYIEDRLKAFIRIPNNEIELFYEKNREFFNEDFYEVRDEIETYLIENELNKRLNKHLKELREKAYIKIQLTD